jgi:hypothetical protein
MSKDRAYWDEISPLLQNVLRLCAERDIPIIAVVELEDTLCTSAYVPEHADDVLQDLAEDFCDQDGEPWERNPPTKH